ncbi:hypothetical protein ACFYUV_14655 [Nonomuraea sp. NPDC003560]|uniref:hypothetical protein n=1 Tax=Nonomuraea sp. NPDC003560 TaxID=3364341 RepID=UPI0036AF6591
MDITNIVEYAMTAVTEVARSAAGTVAAQAVAGLVRTKLSQSEAFQELLKNPENPELRNRTAEELAIEVEQDPDFERALRRALNAVARESAPSIHHGVTVGSVKGKGNKFAGRDITETTKKSTTKIGSFWIVGITIILLAGGGIYLYSSGGFGGSSSQAENRASEFAGAITAGDLNKACDMLTAEASRKLKREDDPNTCGINFAYALLQANLKWDKEEGSPALLTTMVRTAFAGEERIRIVDDAPTGRVIVEYEFEQGGEMRVDLVEERGEWRVDDAGLSGLSIYDPTPQPSN